MFDDAKSGQFTSIKTARHRRPVPAAGPTNSNRHILAQLPPGSGAQEIAANRRESEGAARSRTSATIRSTVRPYF